MPLHVNNGSRVKLIGIRDGSQWRYAKSGYIYQNGAWRLFYGGATQLIYNYNTPGSYNLTVPEGIFNVSFTGCGGGGSGGNGDSGKNNDGPGMGGGGSNLISQGPFNVLPGEVFNIKVGAGGPYSCCDGESGGDTTVTGAGVNFYSQGGGGGGGMPGWGGSGLFVGVGRNGATNGGRPTAGVSTNGGANGGRGGNYSRNPYEPIWGGGGDNGKLTVTFS